MNEKYITSLFKYIDKYLHIKLPVNTALQYLTVYKILNYIELKHNNAGYYVPLLSKCETCK